MGFRVSTFRLQGLGLGLRWPYPHEALRSHLERCLGTRAPPSGGLMSRTVSALRR